MRIDILTLFPGICTPVLGESIVKRAQVSGAVRIVVHDLREYSAEKHRKVDDRPFGGGPGMVIRPEPLCAAIEAIAGKRWVPRARRRLASPALPEKQPARVAFLSPQGECFTQVVAQRLVGYPRLLLVCGHYEGVDQRAIDALVDEEISIGDYVLTGGELPAMVVVDAVVRLLPGVLGDEHSVDEESFTGGLLEYPHYTRPASYRGVGVPLVLLSGDHRRIAQWRRRQALQRTRARRPDLLVGRQRRV